MTRIYLLFQTKDRKMLGFLSVGWGLIADVDIESETLRYTYEDVDHPRVKDTIQLKSISDPGII